ncbi:MAG: ComEA family DNA-binding protein [Gammaproteobacteria bacterium]
MITRVTALVLVCLGSLLAVAQATSTPSAPSTRSTSALININTADATTLAREMKGIGESKARAIVEHRQKNGAFRSVDELALVKGIGSKTLENNRARLTVGAGSASTRPSSGSAAAGPGTRIPAQNAPKPGAGGR